MAADGNLVATATYQTSPVAYTPVPKHVYQRLVRDKQIGALALLIGLIHYLVFQFQSNEAAIPYRTLAQMAGCGMGSIRDRIAVLVKLGYIRVRIQDGLTLYRVNEDIFYEKPANVLEPPIVYQLTSMKCGGQQRQVRHISLAKEGAVTTQRSTFEVACSEIEQPCSEIEHERSEIEQGCSDSERLFIKEKEKEEKEIKQEVEEGTLPAHAHVSASAATTVETAVSATSTLAEQPDRDPDGDNDNPPTGGGKVKRDEYYTGPTRPKRGERGEGAVIAERANRRRNGGQASGNSNAVNLAPTASAASLDPTCDDDSLARQAAEVAPELGDIGFETSGPFPANFRLTPALQAIITAHFGEIPAEALQQEIENFKDYYQARGASRADWVAQLRTWLRKAVNGRFGSTITANGVETPVRTKSRKAGKDQVEVSPLGAENKSSATGLRGKAAEITAQQCRTQIAAFITKQARMVGSTADIMATDIATFVEAWFSATNKTQYYCPEICQREIEAAFNYPGFYAQSRVDNRCYTESEWQTREQEIADGKRSQYHNNDDVKSIAETHMALLAEQSQQGLTDIPATPAPIAESPAVGIELELLIKDCYSPEKSLAEIADAVIAMIDRCLADQLFPIVYKALWERYPQNIEIVDIYQEPEYLTNPNQSQAEFEKVAESLSEILFNELRDGSTNEQMNEWIALAICIAQTKGCLPASQDPTSEEYQEWLSEQVTNIMWVYTMRSIRKALIDKGYGVISNPDRNVA
jgi:hypothetical protein